MSGLSNAESHRVVAHYKGGRLLKGYTQDFAPESDSFKVITARPKGDASVYKVRMTELKAVFFVKRLEGNPLYRERKRFKEVTTSHLRGLRIQIRFADGEVIRGTSMDYNDGKMGFFVSPVDPNSNNLRIYVLNDALTDVKIATEVHE